MIPAPETAPAWAESPTAWSFAPGTTISLFWLGGKRVHAQLIDICGSTLLQQELYRTPGTPIRSFAIPFGGKDAEAHPQYAASRDLLRAARHD